jgi:hypothetical protein
VTSATTKQVVSEQLGVDGSDLNAIVGQACKGIVRSWSFDYKGCAVLAIQLLGNVVAVAMDRDGFSREAPAGFPNSFGFCQFNKKAPTLASPSHPRRSIWRLEDLPRPYF